MPRQPHQTGMVAEWLCCLRLWLTGWQILARRWRCPSGEVDIIARRGRMVSFIEVKARRQHALALASISASQQQRIRNAASMWLAKHQQFSQHDCRFDVMSLTYWPWPLRHRNVF